MTFNSICGFSTFEGAPPEQAAGTACSCPIANHHLRGFGRVRWEAGDLAIIEHHGGSIWIDNAYTGGTRFEFTLPVRADDTASHLLEGSAT